MLVFSCLSFVHYFILNCSLPPSVAYSLLSLPFVSDMFSLSFGCASPFYWTYFSTLWYAFSLDCAFLLCLVFLISLMHSHLLALPLACLFSHGFSLSLCLACFISSLPCRHSNQLIFPCAFAPFHLSASSAVPLPGTHSLYITLPHRWFTSLSCNLPF